MIEIFGILKPITDEIFSPAAEIAHQKSIFHPYFRFNIWYACLFQISFLYCHAISEMSEISVFIIRSFNDICMCFALKPDFTVK